MCTGEIFFARARAVDALSPTRFDRVAATHRRTMDVRAKNFSPGRARLMQNRPTITIAAPQIVAPAPCNHAPHVYGRNIFRPYVRD